VLAPLLWPRAACWFLALTSTVGLPFFLFDRDDRRPAEAVALEQAERWREAAEYYEAKAKGDRGSADFWSAESRRCRWQARLKQRAESPLVVQHVSAWSLPRAVALYGAALDVIKTHACESLSVDHLLARGLRDLDWALQNPAFVRLAFPGGLTENDQRKLSLELKTRWRSLAIPGRAAALQYVQALLACWQRDYAAKAMALVFVFLHGACAAVDEYSAYLPPVYCEREMLAWRGDVASCGLAVGQDRDDLVIQAIAPEGSAAQAGLEVNATILSIDGQPGRSLSADDAELLLLGLAGTQVVIEWQRPPDDQIRRTVLARQKLHLPTVNGARIVDEQRGIGYLQIVLFDQNTPAELDAAIQKLRAQAVQALIIDLRGNPGGLLTAAAAAAGRFLPRNSVAFYTLGRQRQILERYVATAGTEPPTTIPLVVLIDHETASAAEAFAAALEEQLWAVTVGETTWGKGAIQHVLPLGRDGAGLRLSTSRWVTSRGHDLDRMGLRPKWVVSEICKDEPGYSHSSLLARSQWEFGLALRAAREMLQSP
jgi:carboxyl-terminal processing protease